MHDQITLEEAARIPKKVAARTFRESLLGKRNEWVTDNRSEFVSLLQDRYTRTQDSMK